MTSEDELRVRDDPTAKGIKFQKRNVLVSGEGRRTEDVVEGEFGRVGEVLEVGMV